MKLIQRLATIFGVILISAWSLGILFSDAYFWSQWFSWIPTILVTVFLAAVTLILYMVNKKNVAVLFSVLTLILALVYCFIDNRFLTKNTAKGEISILGWTMSHSKETSAEASADFIIGINADITVLTHGWYVRSERLLHDWISKHGTLVVNSQFTIITKYKPIQSMSLIANDGIYISKFVLDTTETLGDILVIWALDLPSTLSNSKMNIAKKVKRLIDETQENPPDIVLGDFNMTRNSVALHSIFPKYQHGADEAGVGLLASFPMAYPLYHIDHTLLADSVIAEKYKLINPKIGRHRTQYIEISAAQ